MVTQIPTQTFWQESLRPFTSLRELSVQDVIAVDLPLSLVPVQSSGDNAFANHSSVLWPALQLLQVQESIFLPPSVISTLALQRLSHPNRAKWISTLRDALHLRMRFRSGPQPLRICHMKENTNINVSMYCELEQCVPRFELVEE